MVIMGFIFRLILAFILGAIVGTERQFKQKSAGLRTNTLVSVGAAAFVLLSIEIGGDAVGRVASYIVSGIGFLGAGVIMKSGTGIRGLNTAATIWCSAAVGSLCGLGLWQQAIAVACMIVLIHLVLRPLGNRINRLSFYQTTDFSEPLYQVVVGCKEQVENHVRVMMLDALKEQKDLQLRSLKSSDNGDPSYSYLTAEVLGNGKKDDLIEDLTRCLSLEKGVSEVSWEVLGHLNE